jgi:hypothetical protein
VATGPVPVPTQGAAGQPLAPALQGQPSMLRQIGVLGMVLLLKGAVPFMVLMLAGMAVGQAPTAFVIAQLPQKMVTHWLACTM